MLVKSKRNLSDFYLFSEETGLNVNLELIELLKKGPDTWEHSREYDCTYIPVWSDKAKDLLNKYDIRPYEFEFSIDDTGRIHCGGIPTILRNKGIGKAMYRNLIKYRGWAYSKRDASTDAQKVWKALYNSQEFYSILDLSQNRIILFANDDETTIEKWFKTYYNEAPGWLWNEYIIENSNFEKKINNFFKNIKLNETHLEYIKKKKDHITHNIKDVNFKIKQINEEIEFLNQISNFIND